MYISYVGKCNSVFICMYTTASRALIRTKCYLPSHDIPDAYSMQTEPSSTYRMASTERYARDISHHFHTLSASLSKCQIANTILHNTFIDDIDSHMQCPLSMLYCLLALDLRHTLTKPSLIYGVVALPFPCTNLVAIQK